MGLITIPNVTVVGSPCISRKSSPHVMLIRSPTTNPMAKSRQPTILGVGICSRFAIQPTAARITSIPQIPEVTPTMPLIHKVSVAAARNSITTVIANISMIGTSIHRYRLAKTNLAECLTTSAVYTLNFRCRECPHFTVLRLSLHRISSYLSACFCANSRRSA